MFELKKTEGKARRGEFTCAHGTAYDIVGKGIAGTSSFENAIKMASRMALASRK